MRLVHELSVLASVVRDVVKVLVGLVVREPTAVNRPELPATPLQAKANKCQGN
jgi:hypothetical protein